MNFEVIIDKKIQKLKNMPQSRATWGGIEALEELKEELRSNSDRAVVMEKIAESLLPCPFCKGNPIQGMFSIRCEKCDAMIEIDFDVSKTKLIEKWNSRR